MAARSKAHMADWRVRLGAALAVCCFGLGATSCGSQAHPQAASSAATSGPSSFECDCTVRIADDWIEHAACLHRAGQTYVMHPRVLAALALDPGVQVFEARSRCGIFYVRRDGRALPTQPFDNGADYLCDGLTRVVMDHKYGYMNARLEVVVPVAYDFAFPFRAGTGVVCNQCQSHPNGEHTAITCERCGEVNTQGRLIRELELSSGAILEQLPAPDDAECGSMP